MSDDLTDDEIALLCDIGQCDLLKIAGDKRQASASSLRDHGPPEIAL
jgi:hypothetical protein